MESLLVFVCCLFASFYTGVLSAVMPLAHRANCVTCVSLACPGASAFRQFGQRNTDRPHIMSDEEDDCGTADVSQERSEKTGEGSDDAGYLRLVSFGRVRACVLNQLLIERRRPTLV